MTKIVTLSWDLLVNNALKPYLLSFANVDSCCEYGASRGFVAHACFVDDWLVVSVSREGFYTTRPSKLKIDRNFRLVGGGWSPHCRDIGGRVGDWWLILLVALLCKVYIWVLHIFRIVFWCEMVVQKYPLYCVACSNKTNTRRKY